MFGETFSGVMESGGCRARGLRGEIPAQFDIQQQQLRLCMIFIFRGGKIGIMKSYIRYSFVLASPVQISPLNLHTERNQIIYGLASLHFHSLCFRVFDCKKWNELHIKLNDCGNIYLFAVPKLHGPLDDWVNIHHVRCCVLLITLQCCSNLLIHTNIDRDLIICFCLVFYDFTLERQQMSLGWKSIYFLLSSSTDQNFNTFALIHSTGLLIFSCRHFLWLH